MKRRMEIDDFKIRGNNKIFTMITENFDSESLKSILEISNDIFNNLDV